MASKHGARGDGTVDANNQPSTGLLVRLNELQSENHSLRSRLNATVEELQVAQRFAAKKPSVQRGRSVEVSCLVDQAAQTMPSSSRPPEKDDAQVHAKLCKLQGDIQTKADRIAALERQVHAQHHKETHGSSSPQRKAAGGELDVLRQRNADLERALKTAAVVSALGSGEDGLDTATTLRRDYVRSLDEVRALQRKCDDLEHQCREQRVALGLVPPPDHVPVGAETGSMPQLVIDADDTSQRMRALFKAYGRPWTPEEVDRLLQQDEDGEIERRLAAAHEQSLAPTTVGSGARQHHHAFIEQTLLANQQLRDELVVASDDLVQAHRKIEELTLAMEMHSRYDDLHVSKSAEVAASESAKQAAREIAFLCDTLSAMKTETDHLSRKLNAVTAERDTAVTAFEELRERSEQMLQGCQEITSTAQSDVQLTIQASNSQLRSRERELSLLRGEMLTVNRQLDEQRQLRSGLESELIDCRTKLLSVKETCAAVRLEAKQAKGEKQALLAQISALQRQLSGAQDKNRILEGQLASSNASQYRPTPRRQPRGHSVSPPGDSSPADSASRSHSAANPDAMEDPHPQQAASPPPPTRSNQRRSLTPGSSKHTIKTLRAQLSGSVVGGESARREAAPTNASMSGDYKDEYEELKQCFLLLLPLVPEALTARDVASGLRDGIERTASRCKQLETELRKKASVAQQARKAQADALSTVEGLQQKVMHVQTLERKMEAKDRLIDKAKREVQTVKEDESRLRGKLKEELAQALSERESLRQELNIVRRELDEGKEVMIHLLRESID